MNHFLKLLAALTLVVLASCSKPSAADVYNEAKGKYQGRYVVTGMESSASGVFVIPDDRKTEENARLDLYHQFLFINNNQPIAEANAFVNTSDGSGEVKIVFYYFSFLTDAEPPYTLDTPVNGSLGLNATWAHHIPFSIQMDTSLLWGETYENKEFKNDRLALALMSMAKVTAFDGKQLKIQIDEFPVYDYNRGKLMLIPVTYTFERER